MSDRRVDKRISDLDADAGDPLPRWNDFLPVFRQGQSVNPRVAAAGFSGYVDPRIFGCVMDGTTDDTAAFALCVAYAQAQDRVIRLPEKTMVLQPMTFTASIEIWGKGPRSVIKWKSGAESTGFLSFTTNPLFAIFRDLTIDSNRQGFTEDATYRAGVRFTSPGTSSNPELTRLECHNVSFVNGRSIDVLVIGQQVANAPATFIGRNLRAFNGLSATSTKGATCFVFNNDVNVDINGCQMFGDPNATYGRAGIDVQQNNTLNLSYRGSVGISNVYAQDIGHQVPSGYIGCVDVYSGADNIVIQNVRCVRPFGRGVTVKADQSNVVVQGVVVDGLRTGGLTDVSLQASSPTIVGRGAVISNITIRNSAAQTAALFVDGGTSAITGASYRGVIISNLVINGCTGRGVYVRNYDDLHLRSFQIMACGSVSFYTAIFPVGNTIPGALQISDGIIRDQTDTGNGVIFIDDAPSLSVSINSVKIVNLPSASTPGIRLDGVRCFTLDAVEVDGGGQGIGVSLLVAPTEHSFINQSCVFRRLSSGSPMVLTSTPLLSVGACKYVTPLSFTNRTRTISAGVLEAQLDWHWVAGEGGVADSLDTITGGVDGQMLMLRAADSTVDIIIKNGTGNIRCGSDRLLDHQRDTITLMRIKSSTVDEWVMTSFADNAT